MHVHPSLLKAYASELSASEASRAPFVRERVGFETICSKPGLIEKAATASRNENLLGQQLWNCARKIRFLKECAGEPQSSLFIDKKQIRDTSYPELLAEFAM
jgi:hypothetical protein